MVRELHGWLAEIVRHNMRRQVVRINRFKPVISLKNAIKEVAYGGYRRNALIVEYKTRSPSGLSVSRDPIEYAKLIEKAAVGVSVLTEELYFGGSYLDLVRIASTVGLPTLMKDFVVSESQIETAYNIGADAVLLIASILKDRDLERLYTYAKNLGLEVLVEVHEASELERVLTLKPDMIGVNARNLRTLEVDLSKAVEVLKTIPDSHVKIAESGIRSRDDIVKLKAAGAKAFLIGTEIMKNPLRVFELGLEV